MSTEETILAGILAAFHRKSAQQLGWQKKGWWPGFQMLIAWIVKDYIVRLLPFEIFLNTCTSSSSIWLSSRPLYNRLVFGYIRSLWNFAATVSLDLWKFGRQLYLYWGSPLAGALSETLSALTDETRGSQNSIGLLSEDLFRAAAEAQFDFVFFIWAITLVAFPLRFIWIGN